MTHVGTGSSFGNMTKLREMPGTKRRRREIPRSLWAFVLFMVISLSCCLVQVFRPQDLSDLEPQQGEPSGVVRDLKAVCSQSIAGSYPLRLTEAEINGYFAKTLVMEQQGALADWVKLEKVLVRLEQGRAELIMVRRCAGMTLTSSMFLKLEQTESSEGGVQTHIDIDGGVMAGLPFLRQGGRWGRLLLPQGFMVFVRPSYAALAAVFSEEIRLGFEEMARVQIGDGVLELDPRFDSGSSMMGF